MESVSEDVILAKDSHVIISLKMSKADPILTFYGSPSKRKQWKITT